MPIFPKLEVKPPKQSHHNRSHYFRTSMAPGVLVPIYCRNVVPGDDLTLDYESLVNTQALLSPLYGSFKLQIDTFFAGTSLYVPQLWRNGQMVSTHDSTLDASYPTFKFRFNDDSDAVKNEVVDSSSLLAYLGFSKGYFPVPLDGAVDSRTSHRQFNAIPILMYLDIFRNYYVNRQEPNVIFIGSDYTASPQYSEITIRQLDDLFLNLPVRGGDISQSLFDLLNVAFQGHSPMAGLFLRTYTPDKMNVILNSQFYKDNVSSVQVSTAGGSFQVDQLVTAKKLWDSRNKDAMSSGTFKDWVRMHYGVTPKIMDDMPTFCGSVSSDIFFEDIRATTTATVGDATQFLGDKASTGKGYLRSRRHRIIADRPGYVMVIASISPRVDYSQFMDRYTMFTKLSDEFRPEYNGIGLQDVLVSDLNADYSNVAITIGEMAAGRDPATASVGKQPAWIEYMTDVNRVRGTFCTTEKSWVLGRDMRAHELLDTSAGGPINNTATTAYIYPHKWNQPFALNSLADQNFLVQFYIKDIVRSSVLKRLRPYF